jgi:hypothetical protein
VLVRVRPTAQTYRRSAGKRPSGEVGGTRTDGLFPQEADGGLDGVQRHHRDGGHGTGIVEAGPRVFATVDDVHHC